MCLVNMIYSECVLGCLKLCKNFDMKCFMKFIFGCICLDG